MGATGVGALLGAMSLAARVGVTGLGPADCDLRRRLWPQPDRCFRSRKIFWLSTVLLVPVGFCMMVQMASSNTLIQAMVPDHLRGRILAVYSMMFMGMAPFGALSAGAVAHRIGAPWTVAAGGLSCIVGAIVFWTQLPAFRKEARELVLAQGMMAGTPAQGANSGGLS